MHPPKELRFIAPTRPHRGIIASTLVLGAFIAAVSAQTSFTHTIGFDDFGYQHGSIIESGAYSSSFLYASPAISVTPPSGGFNKPVIFATQDPNVPGNPLVEDQDLIPNGTGNVGSLDFGNLAIIQENTAFTITDGRINDPYRKVDDHANGGSFRFDFNPGAGVTIDAVRIDLIDVEASNNIKVVAYGANGSFTWTGAQLQALESSIVWGDASANRTSFLTASQAGLTSITRFDVISKTSFAVDNLTFKGTVIPEVSSGFLAVASGLLVCFRRRRHS